MYGTRPAADGWHSEFSDTLEDMGMVRGISSACVFRHPDRGLMCSVHGDDFTTVGPKKHLDWFKSEFMKRYEFKEAARLGPGPNDDKEGRVLNRVVRWTASGLTYEADPRQSEKLIRELGMEGSKAVSTPVTKRTVEEVSRDTLLSSERVTHFRGLAARSNYLSADRPECQFSA